METNELNVFKENLNIFGNTNENENKCLINSEESIESDFLNKSIDFINGFSALDSSAVYESIDMSDSEDNDKENEENNRKSNEKQKINDFCVNNCEEIIKRLIADNEEMKKLKKQLIDLEEQNVELIRDRLRSESQLSQTKDSFERKIILKNDSIEDLKRSLYILESLNSSLQKELHLKRAEKVRLEVHIKEVEDKLYFSEMQLIESQKSEEELLTSYENTKQAFTEEEDNKYKTIERLHSVYVELEQHKTEIQELKQQIADLSREIADKDNELWFYKIKFEESFHNCAANQSDRHSTESQRESIYVNRTTSEVPDYSFSVNDDDLDQIYDFNEDIPTNSSDEDMQFHSCTESEINEKIDNNLETIETKNTSVLVNLFYRFIHCLTLFVLRIPVKLILALILIAISAKLLLSSLLATRLPAYTSWEEIIYGVLVPYVTKVKVSKTQ